MSACRPGPHNNDLSMPTDAITFFENAQELFLRRLLQGRAIPVRLEFHRRWSGSQKDRMWITIFREDDEADQLWRKISVSRAASCVVAEGQLLADGRHGPLRPFYSELHFDQGSVPSDDTPNGEGDRVIEIWNLVFMQFNRDSAGRSIRSPEAEHRYRHGARTLTAVAQDGSAITTAICSHHCWRRLDVERALNTDNGASGSFHARDCRSSSAITF